MSRLGPGRLMLRGLWFYRRTHLGVLIGATLASVVLTGALMIGDSVRHSLLQLARARLGQTESLLIARDRFFPDDLAQRLDDQTPARIAPVLLVDGVVQSPMGDRRIQAVQVVGVDSNFWALAPTPMQPPALPPRSAWVNAAFADRMAIGDSSDAFILILRKPGALPTDMTLAGRRQDRWSQRLRVAGVLDSAHFGQFTLRQTQMPPPTVFVQREWLAEQLDLAQRANVLLIGTPETHHVAPSLPELQQGLEAAWTLADAGLQIAMLPDGVAELRSERVFLDEPVVRAALEIAPNAQTVLTYFVNRIAANGAATPYSFVTAPGPPRVPETLADHQVLINDWLAADLQIAEGAELTLHWYAVDAGGQLEEFSESFSVAGIIDTESVADTDRHLTPEIPGLSDADSCRDWDPGIPIDLDRIRDQDEAYWDRYGGLPKVYLTQHTATRLWQNRFGAWTAVRFPPDPRLPVPESLDAARVEPIEAALRHRLSPAMLGLTLEPAREQGVIAAQNAVDFGQLFTGLSFFLITAALLLTALLFGFNLAFRSDECDTLHALGFRAVAIRRLLLGEGMIVVGIGAILGTLLAPAYNRLLLHGLRTRWFDAVQTTAFELHIRPQSLLMGTTATLLAALCAMFWVLRRPSRLSHREERQPHAAIPDAAADAKSRRYATFAALAGLAIAAGLVLVPQGSQTGEGAAGRFLIAGAIGLAGWLAACRAALLHLRQEHSDRLPGRTRLALRATALRSDRSLACIALMAFGVFTVTAVTANRKGTIDDPGLRASGTGGYRLWGKTTLPLTHDLHTPEGRERYRIPKPLLEDVTLTRLRLREGDDASCLNLNQVTTPHLLGVPTAIFDMRGAFSFARTSPAVDPAHPWRSLTPTDDSPAVIPGVADLNDIIWGMGKTVGDRLQFQAENGQPFEVKLVAGLAGSIFQGHVLIDERHLLSRYPSIGGYQVLLFDTPQDQTDSLAQALSRSLGDYGFEAMSTRQRLAAFNRVENTYLSIFMLLGGLGVLLGSMGMGIVAARNLLERRAELALLRAVGFSHRQLRQRLFREHAALAAAGIAGGIATALIAVLPTLQSAGNLVPWRTLLWMLAGIAAAALLCTSAAIRFALRGNLLDALRNE